MKYLIAILAVGALVLATTNDGYAQKGKGGKGGYGYGGGGYGGYGGGYGHHGNGHGGYGHGYAYGGYGGYGGYHNAYGHGHFHSPQNLGSTPYMAAPAYMAGPPSPTVTYPYYTTRGPRDFLLANPPSIGP